MGIDNPPTLHGYPARQLHFIFVVDASGSMAGDRIASLNYAVRAAIPALREAADHNPEADVLVRVLRFSDTVDWPISNPVPVADFIWTDLEAGGDTNMGAAFAALAEAMSVEAMPGRHLPAVVVLISDGLPTDEVDAPLASFLGSTYGSRAVRLAVAIGADADAGLLQEFIAQPTIKPLQANNAATLVSQICWAASVPIRSVSAPLGAGSPIEAIAQAAEGQTLDAEGMVW